MASFGAGKPAATTPAARMGEPASDGSPDSRSATGDQRCLAGESKHLKLFARLPAARQAFRQRYRTCTACGCGSRTAMILSSRHIDATRDSVFLLLWFRSLLRRGNRTAFLLCCRRLCLFLRRLLLRSLWRFIAHISKLPSLVSRTQELKKPGSQEMKKIQRRITNCQNQTISSWPKTARCHPVHSRWSLPTNQSKPWQAEMHLRRHFQEWVPCPA